jgi:hypothetical protein
MSYDTAAATGLTPGRGDETFGAMASDVAEEFGLDLDPKKVAFCGRRIRDTLDDLNRKKLWRFNLVQAADIPTVPGESTITVPSDLWRLYSTRKSDDVDYKLDGVQQETFDVVFASQNQITGYPYAAVNFNIFRNGTIQLFPTPDGVYQITLRYFRLIAKPSGPKDFIDIPRPYQQVPKYGAMAKVAAFVQQASAMAYWEGKFQEAYADMNRSDEDSGDENLRFINIEEMHRAGYMNPAVRPRYLDFYGWLVPFIGLLLMGITT